MLELYDRELSVLIRVDAGEISNWRLKSAMGLIDVGYQAARQQLCKLRDCVKQ
ncbi:MAG: hypothetical protein QME74_10555 [Candidatus Edwardsbacteria bacterium]|nr:hypothetical protein [Candidatus Edwardsbacteria bacterium]